jgi:motility quorum-sensing regulator/GCU-specific mRNA interferase toxin
MEKSTPHCKLPVVKKLIEAGKVRMTAGAALLAANCLALIAQRLSRLWRS